MYRDVCTLLGTIVVMLNVSEVTCLVSFDKGLVQLVHDAVWVNKELKWRAIKRSIKRR
jgi:hypothetical protein